MHRVREQIGCAPYLDLNFRMNSFPGEAANHHKGIVVAVLDTGMAFHPDLQENIILFRDFVNDNHLAYDDNGHGTHVCGILAGSGLASLGKYQGIAPNTKLLVLKVLDKNGDGNLDTMIIALDWILANYMDYDIRIVNISVGVGTMMNPEKEKRLRNKLEQIWHCGMLVVCAAGNNGPALNSLSDIGKSPYLITVGCHDGEYFKDREDRCAFYSAKGDRYSSVRKPDIVAPGTQIISCNAGFKKTPKGYLHAYRAKSGTSMATPIVSGALALLLETNRKYANEAAKRKLLYSATDLYEPWYQQGWGMVNIKRLLE